MRGYCPQLLRPVRAVLLATAVFPAVFFTPAFAQSTQPDSVKLPLLQQLNNETQTLFQSVKLGLVRVELPSRWQQNFEEANNPVLKWNNRLNAEVREKLRELQARFAAEHGLGSPPFASSTQPDALPDLASRMPRLVVVPRPEGGFNVISSGNPSSDAGPAIPTVKIAGLVLDEAGHILLPVFVEKEAVGDRPLVVIDAAGDTLSGRFIGSDRLTQLTVLQVDAPTGRPLTLSGARPPDGSLLMLLAPGGESGRLSVWTGESQDWGMVIAVDGTIHGFLRGGHFLCADSIRPLAEELVRYGEIRRATLGVVVVEVESSGGRRALRVERVNDRSAAAGAGLKPGDLICSFGGTPVTDFPNFSAAIAQSNGNVDLMVLREGHPVSVTVELHPQ